LDGKCEGASSGIQSVRACYKPRARHNVIILNKPSSPHVLSQALFLFPSLSKAHFFHPKAHSGSCREPAATGSRHPVLQPAVVPPVGLETRGNIVVVPEVGFKLMAVGHNTVLRCWQRSWVPIIV
jgi:hypothetical protein